MESMFADLGLILIVATILAYISKLLKQPLIPAYIITGILIGPILGLVTDVKTIMTLSEIGIAFLLFIVGLEIDVKKLKSVGVVASVGGTMQVFITFLIGFFIAILLSFSKTEAVYMGFIIAFSSTMVVVKLLSDKHELDTLHGRIIIGILLLQDIIAVLALTVLGSLGSVSIDLVVQSILRGVVIFLIAVLAGEVLFPKFFKFAANSQELLFMLSIAVCFLFAMLFSYAGFSIAIGAFVAGLLLANLPYNYEISGRIKPLRNFFATIFFVAIGTGLVFKFELMPLAIKLLLFLAAIMLLKPIVTVVICAFFGYSRRTSILTAVSIAQVSEFSLIMLTLGLSLGHVSQELFSLTILLALLTITATSYIIQFDQFIYSRISNLFGFVDKIGYKTMELEYLPSEKEHEVVVCGYDRVGFSIVKQLRDRKKDVLIVDFNPEVIKKLMKEKVPCIYGDVSDPEIVLKLKLDKAKIVISTIPDLKNNLHIVKAAKHHNKEAVVMVTAEQVDDALQLYNSGTDYVIMPHFLGGTHASILLDGFSKDMRNVIKAKLNHVKELRERLKEGHEHPLKHRR